MLKYGLWKIVLLFVFLLMICKLLTLLVLHYVSGIAGKMKCVGGLRDNTGQTIKVVLGIERIVIEWSIVLHKVEIIPWSPIMSVGNELLDSHHKALLDIINHINSGVSEGRSVEIFQQEYPRLRQYVQKHFLAEEELMELAGYEYLNEHRESHRRITLRLEEISEKLRDHTEDLNYCEICSFLFSWISIHVMGEDKQYVSALEIINPEVYIKMASKDFCKNYSCGDCI